jgi:hypothetical protein
MFGHSVHRNLSSDNCLITFLAVWADYQKSKQAVKEYNRYSSIIKGKAYVTAIPLQFKGCSTRITV